MERLCPISLVTAASRCGLLNDGWPITDVRAWQGLPATGAGIGVSSAVYSPSLKS
jgi:hypothetical protein